MKTLPKSVTFSRYSPWRQTVLTPVDFAIGELTNGHWVSENYVYVAKIFLQNLAGFQQTLQIDDRLRQCQ